MCDHLIVTVNRRQARFFTLEPVRFVEMESGPRIVEHPPLINTEATTPAQEMYTDSKTGRGSAPVGGPVHGYDDKRDQHLDELRRRFAGKVLVEIRRLIKSKKPRKLIVAASARMRRFLYPEIAPLGRQGCEITKLSKNMTNFSPQKIHAYLAGVDLVPEQRRMTV